jgi:hypothetical protein
MGKKSSKKKLRREFEATLPPDVLAEHRLEVGHAKALKRERASHVKWVQKGGKHSEYVPVDRIQAALASGTHINKDSR